MWPGARTLVLSLLIVAGGQVQRAQADACQPRVEHVGTSILGGRIYTYWRIGHDPWRWANISFRYHVTYLDEEQEKRQIEGSFSQYIPREEERYTELKNARYHPARIMDTRYSDLMCEQ